MKTFTQVVNRASTICTHAQKLLGHEAELQRLVGEGCFVRLTSDGKELTITPSMIRVRTQTDKRLTSSPDTSRVRDGKPGSRARIAAYREFYSREGTCEIEGEDDPRESPFTVDLADALASGQERRVSRSKYDVTVSLRADRSDSPAE